MKILIVCLITMIPYFTDTYEVEPIEEVVIEEKLESYNGYVTKYGPDCKGCSGVTASGYNVKDNIYYEDEDYGKVNVLAMDKSIPFGSIVKIYFKDDTIYGIVLDRGSGVGNKKQVQIDILDKSEYRASKFGRKYLNYEILRRGY